MAIKYDSQLKWGDKFYLKTDPDQLEYCLIGIKLTPGKPKLELRNEGLHKITVYEAETSREIDVQKKLNIDNKKAEEDEPDDE